MASDRLLTADQAARQLNIRRTHVLLLIRQRHLTAVRIGHAWRIEPQSIAEYIAAHRQPAAALEAPAVDDRQLALFEPAALEDSEPRLSMEEPTNA